jgi:YVTN family beta-propeller protein
MGASHSTPHSTFRPFANPRVNRASGAWILVGVLLGTAFGAVAVGGQSGHPLPPAAHAPRPTHAGLARAPSPPLPRSSSPRGASSPAGTVVQTLDLASNQLFPGNVIPPIQGGPSTTLFDPQNGMLYVRGGSGETLSVVNVSTSRVVSEIALPYAQTPYTTGTTLALDPVNGLLYTANTNAGNVSVVDPATNRVIASVGTGGAPYGIIYDSFDGDLYVPQYYSDNVTGFSPASDRTVANVTVGFHPTAITYDPVNHEVYVVNSESSNVSVINTTTNTVAAHPQVGVSPAVAIVDTVDDYIDVVAGPGQSNVTVIDGATNTVVGAITVGSAALSGVYVASLDRLFVVNGASNNISVIHQPNDHLVGTISIGHGATSIAYDPVNGLLYTANYGSSNISVINASTLAVANTIGTPNGPSVATVDTTTGWAYITNGGSSVIEANLTVLTGTVPALNGSIPLSVYPIALAYDSGTGGLLAADVGDDSAYEIGPGANLVRGVETVGPEPIALAYDPKNHDTYVVDRGITSVAVVDSAGALVTTIPVGYGPVGLALDLAKQLAFVPDDLGGNVTVINCTTNTVQTSILIKSFDNLAADLFDPANGNLYVADRSGSDVAVIDVATHTVTHTIPVGAEPQSFAYDPSNGTIFVANSGSANISAINDTSDTVVRSIAVYSAGYVTYDPTANLVYDAELYTARANAIDASTYALVGSPVLLGGSEYPMAIAYDPSTQETVVALEDDNALSFISTAATYNVTFHASGLVGGTTWSVTLNGTMNSSMSSDIGFVVGNGMLPFTVGPVTGYVVNRSSGNVSVAGASVVVDLSFTAVAQSGTADFMESGLPQGSEWNLTYDGTAKSAVTPVISFVGPAGTFAYTVPIDGKYTPKPPSGDLTTVASTTVTQNISFSLTPIPGALVVTLIADPSTITLGGSTVLHTVVTGGVAPYHYVYSHLPAGCPSVNGPELNCTPSSNGTSTIPGVASFNLTGSFNITVTVADSTSSTANATAPLQVNLAPSNPAGSTPSSSSFNFPTWWWGIIILIVLGGIFLFYVAWRRRRKPAPAPSETTSPPLPPPSPPPPPPA